MDQRFSGKETGVVDQELGRKVVDPVDDDVIFADDLQRIAGCQSLFIRRDLYVGVQRLNFFSARDDFGTSHVRRMVKNLPVKIGQVHHVAIDEANCADAGCG